jgi:hypothetical protein
LYIVYLSARDIKKNPTLSVGIAGVKRVF